MGSREAVAGAFFGAVAMVAVSVVFAWLGGGPGGGPDGGAGDGNWTHSAILLAPFAAIFGAVAGAVGGLLLRVTRPQAGRQTRRRIGDSRREHRSRGLLNRASTRDRRDNRKR